jgi:hypothetical protein
MTDTPAAVLVTVLRSGLTWTTTLSLPLGAAILTTGVLWLVHSLAGV